MTIEYATADSRSDHVATTIRSAPEWVRKRLNEYREARGLAPIRPGVETREEGRGCILVPDYRGELVEYRGGTLASYKIAPGSHGVTARATPTRSRNGCRVLIVAAFGEATAAGIGDRIPESFRDDAFGDVADLNRYGGWELKDGHQGSILAEAGTDELRAHFVPGCGLVVEWLPDTLDRQHVAVLERIEAGHNGASVAFKVARRTLSERSPFTWTVDEARLTHLALLREGEMPAHPGAHAKVWRYVALGDAAALREHLASVAKTARFRVLKSQGRVVC